MVSTRSRLMTALSQWRSRMSASGLAKSSTCLSVGRRSWRPARQLMTAAAPTTSSPTTPATSSAVCLVVGLPAEEVSVGVAAGVAGLDGAGPLRSGDGLLGLGLAGPGDGLDGGLVAGAGSSSGGLGGLANRGSSPSGLGDGALIAGNLHDWPRRAAAGGCGAGGRCRRGVELGRVLDAAGDDSAVAAVLGAAAAPGGAAGWCVGDDGRLALGTAAPDPECRFRHTAHLCPTVGIRK